MGIAFILLLLWPLCGVVWLIESGYLRHSAAAMLSLWRNMPRAQAVILLALFLWALAYGGDKQRSQGGDTNAPPAASGAETSSPDSTSREATPDAEDQTLPGQAPSAPENFFMFPEGIPTWPFDPFTEAAIAGLPATLLPPIPDAMLVSGLALHRVETNTLLIAEGTNAVPVHSWGRHGADNRAVRADLPFDFPLSTNSYPYTAILSNGRLAFGYFTYHRRPPNGFPFATPYPVALVAPLWGRFTLLPSADSRVWRQPEGDSSFVICWEKLLLEGDPQRPSTVQCEIDRDGTVRWRYGMLAAGAAEAATAGVQNLGPGWAYSHGHTNRILEGMTVTLRPVAAEGWADADPDGDDLTNYDEFMAGTDPHLADSDGDGPSDKWELDHDFDPLLAQLAPPDPDSDGDLIPDRWEQWLGSAGDNPASGAWYYLDNDGDGFFNLYENILGDGDPASPDTPGAPAGEYETDILAVVTSSVPCVLRLTRESDSHTTELPWHPAYSPREMRLRLIRGEQYQATLSRVPLGSGFTTDGFWWSDLDFAVPPGIETLGLPPTIDSGIMTRHLGTVCVRSPVRELPPWVVPGYADLLATTLAAWKIEIEEPEPFCHGATVAKLQLTEDSLYEGIIEWRGLPPVEVRTGNPLEFDPSSVPPGRHIVAASVALNPLVADVAEVDIVHIGVATNVVWLSSAETNEYAIPLSGDTYPTDGIDVWSEPEGIYSQSFTPSTLTPGVYTVSLTHGLCGVAQMTVNVFNVDLDLLWETANKANRIFNPTKKDDKSDAGYQETDSSNDTLYGIHREKLYVVSSTQNQYAVSLDLNIQPVSLRSQFVVAAYKNGMQVAGSATPVPAQDDARIDMTFADPTSAAAATDFAVKAGLDADGSATLDAGEMTFDLEVYRHPGDNQPRYATIFGINNAKYDWHNSEIAYYLNPTIGGIPVDPGAPDYIAVYARSFLYLFMNGDSANIRDDMMPTTTAQSQIDSFQQATTNSSCFSEWLTHNAGAGFSDQGVASITRREWNDESRVARFLARRTPLELETVTTPPDESYIETQTQTGVVLEQFYDSHVKAVAEALLQDQPVDSTVTMPQGGGFYSFPNQHCDLFVSESPLWVPSATIRVGEGNAYGGKWGAFLAQYLGGADSFDEYDAAGAIGRGRLVAPRYQFTVKKTRKGIWPVTWIVYEVTAVHFACEIEDLYDFNYEDSELASHAAAHQIGYSNGNMGRNLGVICRNKIWINYSYIYPFDQLYIPPPDP